MRSGLLGTPIGVRSLVSRAMQRTTLDFVWNSEPEAAVVKLSPVKNLGFLNIFQGLLGQESLGFLIYFSRIDFFKFFFSKTLC